MRNLCTSFKPPKGRCNIAATLIGARVTGIAFLGILMGSALSAQTAPKSNAWSTTTLTKTGSDIGLGLTDIADLPSLIDDNDVAGISPVLKNALFNLPTDNTSPLFKLDLGGNLCLDTAINCEQNELESVDIRYAQNFSRDALGGINLAITPRAGVSYDNEGSNALLGALFEIRDTLKTSDNTKLNSWYLFAGADAQALSFTPDGAITQYGDRFGLQNQVIVGDAQAGLGYRVGEADLSLTYLRRAARAENYEFEEDAAALSLTWRR